MDTLKQQLMTALVAAQAEMDNAVKDSKNPFFKSNYADLTSVMGVIKPAFAKHGLGFIQVCHEAEDAAKIETIIIHSSGETISCGCVAVPVSKSDAQGYGSALTYARRYSLAAAVGVGAEDDDGNAAAKAAPKKQDKPFVSAHTSFSGAMESLPKEEQESIKELSEYLSDLIKAGSSVQAYRHLESQNLDADQKVALRGIMNSKDRAVLLKEHDKVIAAKLDKFVDEQQKLREPQKLEKSIEQS